MLNADVKAHFAAGNNTYSVRRAIALVARETKAQLESRLRIPSCSTGSRAVS